MTSPQIRPILHCARTLIADSTPLGASESRAFGWCAYVHTCALLKWPPLPVPYEQKNALALQRSSFRENPTTSIRRWVCELVFDAIYDWRSEFSHNRQTDRPTRQTTVTLAAHARRGLMKALKCKPSALKALLRVREAFARVNENVTESIRKTGTQRRRPVRL